MGASNEEGTSKRKKKKSKWCKSMSKWYKGIGKDRGWKYNAKGCKEKTIDKCKRKKNEFKRKQDHTKMVYRWQTLFPTQPYKNIYTLVH